MQAPALDWVTQTQLRQWVAIDGMVHPHWYKASIRHAMALDVRPCLGNALYELVNAEILAGTLTPANLDLRDQWAPAIAHYTIWHAGINGLYMRIEDIGVVQNQDPTTVNPSASDLAYWRQEMKNRAEAYKRIALEFMRENYVDYPLWKDFNTCSGSACRTHDYHFEFYAVGNGRATRPPIA